MAEVTRLGELPRTDRSDVLAIPVWRIRLKLFWRSLRNNAALFAENPIGLVGIGIIIFFGLLALAHPILMNTVWSKNVYDPVVGIDLEIPFHPAAPSPQHLLGTDPLGRDVLSQLMWSTRSEFALGVVAALVTVVIATTVGGVSAYYGGMLDAFFMRLADLVIMTPFVTILIVLSALFDAYVRRPDEMPPEETGGEKKAPEAPKESGSGDVEDEEVWRDLETGETPPPGE